MPHAATSNWNERLAATAGAGLLVSNQLLLKLGLRGRLDGWRRGAGLVLREEAATFVLSAFSLDIWSDGPPPSDSPGEQSARDHLADRLSRFFGGEPDVHVR